MGIENVLDRLIEDIDRLSGVNLNQAICLTLGLEIDVYARKIEVIFRMPRNIARTMRCPDWANNANAALELISVFSEEHDLYEFIVRPSHPQKWSVMVCRYGQTSFNENIRARNCVGNDGDNVATEICKVWLKAVAATCAVDSIYQIGKESKPELFDDAIYMAGDEEEVARKFNGRTYLIANKSGIHIVARSAIV